MIDLKELYYKNVDFKRYVERYSICYRISTDDALHHALVREYANYLNNEY